MKIISGDYTEAWVLTSTQTLWYTPLVRELDIPTTSDPSSSSWRALCVLNGENYSWLLETSQTNGAARFTGRFHTANTDDLRLCWWEHKLWKTMLRVTFSGQLIGNQFLKLNLTVVLKQKPFFFFFVFLPFKYQFLLISASVCVFKTYRVVPKK